MTYLLGLGLSLLFLLVLFGLLAWPRARSILWLIVLTRYSVMIGVLLPALYLGGILAPSLLENVFVLVQPFQIFNVTWLSLLVALMVLVTFRVTQLNAPRRFSEYGAAVVGPAAGLPKAAPGWSWRWALFFLIGLPLPVLCLVKSWSEVGPIDPSPAFLLLALGGGVVLAVLVLAALTALQQLLLPPEVSDPDLLPFENRAWSQKLHCYYRAGLVGRIGEWLAWGLNRFGPGYADPVAPPNPQARPPLRLRPGHAQLLLCTAVLVLVFGARYAWIIYTGQVPTSANGTSAAYDILVILLVGGLMMCGMTFFLDYYRVPVEVALLVLSLVLWNVNKTDYYYLLKSGDESAPLLLDDVYGPDGRKLPVLAKAEETGPAHGTNEDREEARRLRKKAFAHRAAGAPSRGKTLVVVTAPGGGIHAAAWAGQVLVGLHDRYTAEYRESLGLISAVSGGSVGTMYYLERWDPDARGHEDPLPAEAGEQVVSACMASSLEATAWGTSHTDLLRAIFPPLVGPNWDRGRAIEEAWAARMRDRNATLCQWRERVRAGKLPAAVFNATIAETGQRLVISPVQLLAKDKGEKKAEQGREFFTLYPKMDLKVSTAARLSATFPYISPIARPMWPARMPEDDGGKDYHVADGGYVDNEGMLTAMEWVVHLLNQLQKSPDRPFDRVVLIRIQPFPEEPAQKATQYAGWSYGLVGPLETLQAVRTASQSERDNLGAEMLSNTVAAQASAATQEMKSIESSNTLGNKPEDVERGMRLAQAADVEVIPLMFRYKDPDWKEGDPLPTIPLSWKLTSKQQNKIRQAWKTIEDDAGKEKNPFTTLDRYFEKRPGK